MIESDNIFLITILNIERISFYICLNSFWNKICLDRISLIFAKQEKWKCERNGTISSSSLHKIVWTSYMIYLNIGQPFFIEILWCHDNYLRNQTSTYLRRQWLRQWNMCLLAQIRALPLPSFSRNLISVSDCTFCNLNLSRNPSIFRKQVQLSESPPQLSPTQVCPFFVQICGFIFPNFLRIS